MANLKNKSLKKSLSEQAKDNATVTKGTSKSQTVLKEGVPNDHSRKKHSYTGSAPIVGVSIGSTLNMGNYESLRADVWLSDEVHEGETVQQAYQRVTAIVDETLQEIVSQYK